MPELDTTQKAIEVAKQAGGFDQMESPDAPLKPGEAIQSVNELQGGTARAERLAQAQKSDVSSAA